MNLTITIIQANLIWENKEGNLQMLQEKIDNIQGQTEVVVLPEMFSTGFSMNVKNLAETMDGPTVAWMKETAAKKNFILMGSIIIKEKITQYTHANEAYYNRLIWMLPTGEYGIYDKRHLFAYANENAYYTPGNKRLIASVKGWKINLQVCYDLRFPVWSRQNQPSSNGAGEEPEYDILINVANWPQRRNMVWKALLQARAIENQCYAIGVNRVGNDGNDIYYSGDSMVINPLGEMLYHKEKDEDVFTITLQKEELKTIREQFPFWKDGDTFQII